MLDLTSKIKLTYDINNTPYPVAHCPYCETKVAPISFIPDGSKFFLCCHHVIDKPIPVLGYVSLIDLEETEWDTEL